MPRIEVLALFKDLILSHNGYYISIASELDLEYGFSRGNSEFAKILKSARICGRKEKGSFYYGKIY